MQQITVLTPAYPSDRMQTVGYTAENCADARTGTCVNKSSTYLSSQFGTKVTIGYYSAHSGKYFMQI